MEYRCLDCTTGDTIAVDLKVFLDLKEFKSYLSNKWGVPRAQILLLYPFGIKLKDSNFKHASDLESPEIYVYDRRLFSLTNEPHTGADAHADSDADADADTADVEQQAAQLLDSLLEQRRHPQLQDDLIRPIPSPLEDLKIADGISHRTAVSMLTTNLGWLSALEIDVNYYSSISDKCKEDTQSLARCLGTCEQYLGLYCYDVERLYNSNVVFLDQLHENSLQSRWKECYKNTLRKLAGLNGYLSQYVDEAKQIEKEVTLKSLDGKVNSKLKQIKKELDSYADQRKSIQNEIENLKNIKDMKNDDNELHEMQKSFDSIADTVRKASRDILDKDDALFTDEYITQEVVPVMIDIQKKVKTLLTVSQALYENMHELLTHKRNFQIQIIVKLGQIAWIQLQISELKQYLLNDCNADLTLYKDLEVEFAQIEDYPLIYGLYLVEKYRRQVWKCGMAKNMISISNDIKERSAAELTTRKNWYKNFGELSKPFNEDLTKYNDLDEISKLMNSDSQFLKEKYIQDLRNEQRKLEDVIKSFIKNMHDLGLSKETTQVLEQSFKEASNSNISSQIDVTYDHRRINNENDLIKRYKIRIRKLESLLHEQGYSSISKWPSGVLNHTDRPNYFADNVSPAGRSLLVSSSALLGLEPSASLKTDAEMFDLKKEIGDLSEKVTALEKDNKLKTDQLKITHSKLIDIEVEKAAFRETLNHLNKELARLTVNEEDQTNLLKEERLRFKKEMTSVTVVNQNLMNNLDALQKTFEDVELENAHLKSKLKELQQRQDQLIEDSANEKLEIKSKYEKLIKEKDENMGQAFAVTNKAISGEQNKTESDIIHSSPYPEAILHLRTELFDIFSTNIYILENIGLLLTETSAGKFEIKRVKGLKKGLSQSLLDESAQISPIDGVINSVVYKNIRAQYEQLPNDNNISNCELFISSVKKIYENKLFESAVINRFKDIETLAKRLTKENKSKRILIDLYQNERLAVKDFRVNDLALFLPTKEALSETKSLSSSMASSFSSVDLSTPISGANNNITASRKSLHKPNVKHPWAAFTAFNESSRYFLKDENMVTDNKEWFIGKITDIQRLVVENISTNNPFKLPKDTVWYLISAEMISID